MGDIDYLHLSPDQAPPDIGIGPFRAVVVIDEPVTAEWRDLVSGWLVRSGCLYMSAWGLDCGLWDDSVDYANLEEFDYGDIPADRSVMTTWHAREPLSQAFWFAAHCANHPDVELKRTLVVHIARGERRAELLAEYHEAAGVEA